MLSVMPIYAMQLTTLQSTAHQLLLEKTPIILRKYKQHIMWGSVAFGAGYLMMRLLNKDQQKTANLPDSCLKEAVPQKSQHLAQDFNSATEEINPEPIADQSTQKPQMDESKSEKRIQQEPDWVGINTRMQMISDILSPAGFKLQTGERSLDGIMILTTKGGSHWLMLYRYSTQKPACVRIAKIQWPHLSCMPITFRSMDRELLKQMVPKKQTLNAKSCTFTDEEFMFKVTAKIDKSNVIFNAHHLLKDYRKVP